MSVRGVVWPHRKAERGDENMSRGTDTTPLSAGQVVGSGRATRLGERAIQLVVGFLIADRRAIAITVTVGVVMWIVLLVVLSEPSVSLPPAAGDAVLGLATGKPPQ